MALWVCDECSTAYAPGAPACPHCGESKHHEQGAEAMEAEAQEPPAASAVKAEWVAYAVAQGMDRAEAEGMTKDALREALTAEPEAEEEPAG